MTWFKVDDKFWSHPKILTCSLAARGLWITAGSYCAQHETDGFIPESALHTFGFMSVNLGPDVFRAESVADSGSVLERAKKAVESCIGAAEELVRAGLWRRVEDGYTFRDWSDYQPTAKALREKRAADRQRKAKAKAAKSEKIPSGFRSDSENLPRGFRSDSEKIPSGFRESSGSPDPARIYTSSELANARSSEGGAGGGNHAQPDTGPGGADAPAATAAPQAQTTKPKPAKRATPLPADWTPGPSHANIAAENGANVTLEAARYRDWLTATGKTYRDHDAAFRNWLRRATPSPAPAITAPPDELAAARNARRQRHEPRPDAVPPTREFLDLKAKLAPREGAS